MVTRSLEACSSLLSPWCCGAYLHGMFEQGHTRFFFTQTSVSHLLLCVIICTLQLPDTLNVDAGALAVSNSGGNNGRVISAPVVTNEVRPCYAASFSRDPRAQPEKNSFVRQCCHVPLTTVESPHRLMLYGCAGEHRYVGSKMCHRRQQLRWTGQVFVKWWPTSSRQLRYIRASCPSQA